MNLIIENIWWAYAAYVGIFTVYLILVFLAVKLSSIKHFGRKLTHIGSGTIMVLCARLHYTSKFQWRLLLASVPFGSSLLILGMVTKIIKFPLFQRIMSRENGLHDLIRGPLIYGFCMGIAALFFINDIAGLLSVAVLCFGDGFAEIFGSNLGKKKWWFSEKKSYVGTIAFAVCSVLGSMFFLWYFNSNLTLTTLWKLAAVAVISGVIEIFDPKGFDNASVYLSGLLFGHIFFGTEFF
ncbi:hypothetical protein PCE1_004812 [Barthelona sp. PCE]